MFAYILKLGNIIGNHLQQMTFKTDDIRVNLYQNALMIKLNENLKEVAQHTDRAFLHPG